MEHFFHKYLRWLHHHSHKLKKSISHREIFHSKNNRLLIILLISLAIPLTVFSVQQIQDFRQKAQSVPKAACDGKSTGLLAEPRPAIKDQKIVFRHTEVNDLPPIDQQSFDEWDSLGNGVYRDNNAEKKCKLVGNTIECIARGTAAPGATSKHTWIFRELAVCEYEVKNEVAKPGGTGSEQTTCKDTTIHLDVNQSVCTANDHTKISGNWKISGNNCVITLYEDGKVHGTSDKCSNGAWYTSDSIEPGKKYQLKAKSTVCTGKTLESNIITSKACVPMPTRDPAVPGADDIDVHATPTKVPLRSNCPGGVCP